MVIRLAAIVFICMTIKSSIRGDPCDDSNFIQVIHKFKDNATADEPIYIYNDSFKDRLQLLSCKISNSFRMDGLKVYLNTSLTNHCGVTRFDCDVGCNNTRISSVVKQTLALDREYVPTGLLYFRKDSYVTKVRENSFPGNIFEFSVAKDIFQTGCFGFGGSGVGQYLNIYDSNLTSLFETGKTVNQFNVQTKGQLDYEKNHEYSIPLVFRQEDSGGQNRQNYTTLIVRVIDVDDMDPVFNETSYTYDIYENHMDNEWNTTTPEIAAYDQDLGEGRQNLTYKMEVNTFFEMNPENGQIRNIRELDRETGEIYRFKITVVQDNDSKRSATASLVIHVLDRNDNLPNFDKSIIYVAVDEHSSTGTYVTSVSAKDIDEFPNNKVRYVLSNYTDQLYIETSDDQSATIRVNSSTALDREDLGDVLIVKVIAYDATNGTEGDTLTLNITLIDINDNTPKFSKTNYDFLGSAVGPVGQVEATDKDDPGNGNGRVTYNLNNPVSEVQISDSTGQINLTNPLEEDIDFFVEACDNPIQQSSRRCSQTHVRIRANSSETVNREQNATVKEHSSPNTLVAIIEVKGSLYVYKPIGETVPFHLDEKRGTVTVKDDIDRENGTDIYEMNISVLSKSNWTIGNVTLKIQVLDVNDNTPIFGQSEYFFKLPDTLSMKTAIGSVNATDMDIGNNSLLHYYIPPSLISPYFEIDPNTGEIRIADINLPKGREVFQFPVSAKDHGSPPLQSACYVFISRTIVQGTLVEIGTPFTLSELRSKQNWIESELNRILQPHTIKITKTEGRDVEAQVETKSYMFIQASNTSGAIIAASELQRSVLQHMDSIHELFRQQALPTTQTDNDFGASQIALIVLAAIILFGGILFIYMIYKSRSNKPKYDTSLVTVDEEKETDVPKGPEQDHVSMHSIEVTVDLGDEQTNQSDQTSDYDGSQNAISESNAVGCINPAYEVESNEVVLAQDGMQENATSKEVEHELDRLSDMLEKEERKSFTENASNASGVEDEEGVVQKLYPSLHTNENEAGLNDNHDHEYENTFWCGQSGDNGHANEFETSNDENQDRESGEFIAESTKPYDQSTMKDGISSRSYENIVDVLDEEPDIDYNDKQVRFAAVVLDSEENKFEPLKDKGDENTTEAEENEDDQTHEDNRENDSGLEYQQDENSTLPEVNETPFEDVALEEEVTAF